MFEKTIINEKEAVDSPFLKNCDMTYLGTNHLHNLFRRAGILYINPGDLGWNPYVTSWIETRDHQAEKANLTILFDKYVPSLQVLFADLTYNQCEQMME